MITSVPPPLTPVLNIRPPPIPFIIPPAIATRNMSFSIGNLINLRASSRNEIKSTLYIVQATKRLESSLPPQASRKTLATRDVIEGARPIVYLSNIAIPMTPESGNRYGNVKPMTPMVYIRLPRVDIANVDHSFRTNISVFTAKCFSLCFISMSITSLFQVQNNNRGKDELNQCAFYS